MTTTEYEQALVDPGAVFARPEDILPHPGLSDEQKIALLKQWEYDAAELSVAEEEGMGGGEQSLTRQILLALGTLSGARDVEHSSPTKQGGG